MTDMNWIQLCQSAVSGTGNSPNQRTKFMCETLTITGTYDCATASACFGGNYIPAEALVEVRRILKPGRINE